MYQSTGPLADCVHNLPTHGLKPLICSPCFEIMFLVQLLKYNHGIFSDIRYVSLEIIQECSYCYNNDFLLCDKIGCLHRECDHCSEGSLSMFCDDCTSYFCPGCSDDMLSFCDCGTQYSVTLTILCHSLQCCAVYTDNCHLTPLSTVALTLPDSGNTPMCKGCFAKVDCCQECGEDNNFLFAYFKSFETKSSPPLSFSPR